MTNEQLKPAKERFLALGFTEGDFIRESSFALQIINKSKQLKECTPESILESVVNLANIGLTLNPISKECYLITRWNGQLKTLECKVEPSYMGLIKLLVKYESVKSIVTNIVYENDNFSVDLADNIRPVNHSVSFGDRGEMKGVYCLSTLMDGTKQVEIMSMDEINLIRERSDSYIAFKAGKIKSCTWESDYGEMSRKTVIKRAYKYLPKKDAKIDEAIHIDNADYSITNLQEDYILSLLRNSALGPEEREGIEMELAVMNIQRAGDVIEWLKNNQLNVVTSGNGNPSQSAQAEAIKELVEIDNAKEELKK